MSTPKPPTFLEVLQAALDAAGPDPRSRSLVVHRVLQQLGTVINPELARTKDGAVYTWRAVPLVGDLVLGADGKLTGPKAKEEPVVVANPDEAPAKKVSWATSFAVLRRECDAAQLRAALRVAVPVLLAGPP